MQNRIRIREQGYTHISGRATVAVYVCSSCVRQNPVADLPEGWRFCHRGKWKVFQRWRL